MKGMIVIQILECNGKVVVVVLVVLEDEIMLIMMGGVLICICVDEIWEMGCVMQGVMFILVGEGNKLFGL